MLGIIMGVLFLLLFSGLPIGFTLATTSLVFFYLTSGPAVTIAVPQGMFNSLDSYILLAVPMFILAGNIMGSGNITGPLIKVAEAFIGHLRAGLALVLVTACAFFAAISGSSLATLAAIGVFMMPEMLKRGYSPKYTVGLTAVSAGLGVLIPPSIPMIVYSSLSNESVASLFLAGVFPGLLLAGVLMLISLYIFRNQERKPKESWGFRLTAIKKSLWGLFLPVIIFGGIYGGIFTPTEAAGVSAVYAYLIGALVYKGIKRGDTMKILADAAIANGTIMFIIAGCGVFGKILAFERVPQMIVSAVISAGISPYMFILIVNLILFVCGCFLESISILVLTMPLFLPIAMALGIDLLHFAALFVVNMEIAFITPPVGLNLYMAARVADRPIGESLRGSIPFCSGVMVVLAITSYWPPLSTWLPRVFKW